MMYSGQLFERVWDRSWRDKYHLSASGRIPWRYTRIPVELRIPFAIVEQIGVRVEQGSR